MPTFGSKNDTISSYFLDVVKKESYHIRLDEYRTRSPGRLPNVVHLMFKLRQTNSWEHISNSESPKGREGLLTPKMRLCPWCQVICRGQIFTKCLAQGHGNFIQQKCFQAKAGRLPPAYLIPAVHFFHKHHFANCSTISKKAQLSMKNKSLLFHLFSTECVSVSVCVCVCKPCTVLLGEIS